MRYDSFDQQFLIFLRVPRGVLPIDAAHVNPIILIMSIWLWLSNVICYCCIYVSFSPNRRL